MALEGLMGEARPAWPSRLLNSGLWDFTDINMTELAHAKKKNSHKFVMDCFVWMPAATHSLDSQQEFNMHNTSTSRGHTSLTFSQLWRLYWYQRMHQAQTKAQLSHKTVLLACCPSLLWVTRFYSLYKSTVSTMPPLPIDFSSTKYTNPVVSRHIESSQRQCCYWGFDSVKV